MVGATTFCVQVGAKVGLMVGVQVGALVLVREGVKVGAFVLVGLGVNVSVGVKVGALVLPVTGVSAGCSVELVGSSVKVGGMEVIVRVGGVVATGTWVAVLVGRSPPGIKGSPAGAF